MSLARGWLAERHPVLRVELTDRRGVDLQPKPLGDGRNPRWVRLPAGGHCLIGMQERVQLHGGELRFGPRARGGFEVLARLPYEAADG